ncbi:uncharacterized protein LOC135164434 [Diachasmimorpha longicaudata]|uniref:uncharacterized protein LOC135164434 n=1 Tax=Diachasmimorpha longicaudata TaxID=58733 RepID=UPI0030B9001B
MQDKMSTRTLLFVIVAVIFQIQGHNRKEARGDLVTIIKGLRDLKEKADSIKQLLSSIDENSILQLEANLVGDKNNGDFQNPVNDTDDNLSDFKACIVEGLENIRKNIHRLESLSSSIDNYEMEPVELDPPAIDDDDYDVEEENIEDIETTFRDTLASGINNLKTNSGIIWSLLALVHKNINEQMALRVASVNGYYQNEILMGSCSGEQIDRCRNLTDRIIKRIQKEVTADVDECYQTIRKNYTKYHTIVMDEYLTKQKVIEVMLDAAYRKLMSTEFTDVYMDKASAVFDDMVEDWLADVEKQERLNVNWLIDQMAPMLSCTESSWNKIKETLLSHHPAIMTCGECSDSDELRALESWYAAIESH